MLLLHSRYYNYNNYNNYNNYINDDDNNNNNNIVRVEVTGITVTFEFGHKRSR